MTRSPSQAKIIGIVGGLGPHAHIDFEQKLLVCANELVGAKADQEYPEWIVSSVPSTPDRTQAIFGHAPDPTPALLKSARLLENAGAGILCVPCNSAHYFLPAVRESVGVPILDMIALTAAHIAARDRVARVGLLTTTGTLQSRLYHKALNEAGIDSVSPLDLPEGDRRQLEWVMEPIYGPAKNGRHQGGGIKAEGDRPEYGAALEQAASALIAEGAEAVVAGCTEIPLSLTGPDVQGVPLIDPTRVLAEATIREAYELGP